jgi:hypothetical protein
MDFWARRTRNGEDILPPIYFHNSQVLPLTDNIWYVYIFLILEVTIVQYSLQESGLLQKKILLQPHFVTIIRNITTIFMFVVVGRAYCHGLVL